MKAIHRFYGARMLYRAQYSKEKGSPTNEDKETKLRINMQAGLRSPKLYTSPYSCLSLYPPVTVQPSLFQTG